MMLAAACLVALSAVQLVSGFYISRDDLWRGIAQRPGATTVRLGGAGAADRRWPARRYYLDPLGGANVLDRKEVRDDEAQLLEDLERYEEAKEAEYMDGSDDSSSSSEGDAAPLRQVDVDSDAIARAIASMSHLAPGLPAKRAFDSIDRDSELKRAGAAAAGDAAGDDQGVLVFGKFAAISPLSQAYPWYEMNRGDSERTAAGAAAAEKANAAKMAAAKK